MELAVLDFIQNNLRSGALDVLMVIVTYLGEFGAIWLVGAAAAFFTGRRKMGVTIVVAVVLAGIVGSLVMKPLFARARPCDVNLAVSLLVSRPTSYSFPSGHTAVAFAAVTVLFCDKSRWRVPALVLAILIGFSRLYLYVHYPTDVLAGALLGMLCGMLVLGIRESRGLLKGSGRTKARMSERTALTHGGAKRREPGKDAR
jgi:undecaprenyl-diphosphatase